MPTWISRNLLAVLGLVLAAGPIFASLMGWIEPRLVPWVLGAAIVLALGILLWRFLDATVRVYREVHRVAAHLVPWFAFAVLVMSVAIWFAVQPPGKRHCVEVTRAKGAVYNSWDRQAFQNKHIYAYGSRPGDLMLIISGLGEAGFSYIVDPRVPWDDPHASSGFYITFYGKPIDRLVYDEMSFDCKATDVVKGEADVGVRLSVDDPNSAGDRERVT
jgi:hypothetical protein